MNDNYEILFGLRSSEVEKLVEWAEAHDPTCKFHDDGTLVFPPGGAIGGRITYAFTPTSLGVVTIVKCACGEKLDLTDYDCW